MKENMALSAANPSRTAPANAPDEAKRFFLENPKNELALMLVGEAHADEGHPDGYLREKKNQNEGHGEVPDEQLLGRSAGA